MMKVSQILYACVAALNLFLAIWYLVKSDYQSAIFYTLIALVWGVLGYQQFRRDLINKNGQEIIQKKSVEPIETANKAKSNVVDVKPKKKKKNKS